MPADNCQHSSTPISHQTANRLIGKFLTDRSPTLLPESRGLASMQLLSAQNQVNFSK
jgi:hypothetical protein